MDFTEYVELCLNRLRDYVINSPDALHRLYRREELYEVFLQSTPRPDSTEMRAAESVFQSISDLRIIELGEENSFFLDNANYSPKWKINPQAELGMGALLEGALFRFSEQVSDFESGVISFVNNQCEIQRSDHCFLVSIKRATVASHLASQGVSALQIEAVLGINLAEKDARGTYPIRPIPYLNFEISGNVDTLRSTLDSLLIERRHEQIQQQLSREWPIVLEEGYTNIDLSFIADDRLSSLLENDWVEAQICERHELWKSASLLYAGLVEGIMIWLFRDSEYSESPNAVAAKAQLRQSGKTTGDPYGVRWRSVGLNEIHYLAKVSKFLDKRGLRLLENVREIRDTVHPLSQLEVDRADNQDCQSLRWLLNKTVERIRSGVL